MSKIITDEQKINAVLTKGVEEAIDRESLERKLKSGKQLRIKFGVDPTAPDLHLGHSVPLRKLKEFQNLGHKAVLIIGDFTAMIGDPTGKSETRKPLTEREVKENLKKYLKQAEKIIDIKKAEIKYNSSWFKKKGTSELLKLTAAGSIQQVLHRADFKKRIDEGNDITLSEVIYPLLQGYDSVKVKSDIELGGTDQKFNLLMGRKVQRYFNQPEQDIITVPLLEGLDGARKMSKSFDNYIGVREDAESIFGKIMSIPDNLILKYFELLTDFTENEISEIKNKMKDGENPRDFKMRLAEEIVKLYYNEKAAEKARENFIKVFSKREMPEEIKELKFTESPNIVGFLLKTGLVKSKSQAWSLVQQGAIEINKEKIKDPHYQITSEVVVKIGKKHFIKVVFK